MVKHIRSFPRIFSELFFVGFGAVPGALIRWTLNNDFACNMIGAACFGFVLGLSVKPRIRLLLGAGFCGSLTTFSSWIISSLELIIKGEILKSMIVIIIALLLGLFSSFLGFFLGRKINSLKRFQ